MMITTCSLYYTAEQFSCSRVMNADRYCKIRIFFFRNELRPNCVEFFVHVSHTAKVFFGHFFQVVKLHTRLGKPIPPPDPKAAAAIAALNAQEEAKSKTNNVATAAAAVTSAAPVRVSATPRITFIAGEPFEDNVQSSSSV